jgi:hypothetical protein
MKRAKAKLTGWMAVPLLALSFQCFAAEAVQPSPAEPVQLSMAEMDNVTAAGFIDIYVTIIINYGQLNIGNVQGSGGTGAYLNMAKTPKRYR